MIEAQDGLEAWEILPRGADEVVLKTESFSRPRELADKDMGS